MNNQNQPRKVRYIFTGDNTYEVVNGFTELKTKQQ